MFKASLEMMVWAENKFHFTILEIFLFFRAMTAVYMHACMHNMTYIHTCMHVYIHTCIHSYTLPAKSLCMFSKRCTNFRWLNYDTHSKKNLGDSFVCCHNFSEENHLYHSLQNTTVQNAKRFNLETVIIVMGSLGVYHKRILKFVVAS